MDRFAACFADLKDPHEDNARHLLLDLLVIGFCTILCDGKDCSDMALFGRAKEGPATIPAPIARHPQP